MDLTNLIIAKSDQLNSDDLMAGPQTFTVAEVRRGDAEQPVAIVLAELGPKRPFKPSKTALRVLVHAWGKETDDWPQGARMTLYRNEKVKWAGQEVGGIRISHLSHIPMTIKVALAESKGKKSLQVVEPLPDAPAVHKPASNDILATQAALGIAEASTEADVREWGNRAHGKGLLDLTPDGHTVTLREMVQQRIDDLANEPDASPTDQVVDQ